MYKELKKAMIDAGLGTAEIAERMLISTEALRRRLKGEQELKLSEAIKIKQILNSDLPIEKLFETATTPN